MQVHDSSGPLGTRCSVLGRCDRALPAVLVAVVVDIASGDSMPTFSFFFSGHFFLLRHILWSCTHVAYDKLDPVTGAFLNPCSMHPVPGNLDGLVCEEGEG